MQKLRELSLERQREVLDFVELLETKTPPAPQNRLPSKKFASEISEGLVGSLEGGPGDLATNPDRLNPNR